MIGEENGATTDDLRDVTPGRYAALMDEVMTLRQENAQLKQQRPAAEYRWQWGKPNCPGVWAFGGRTPDRRCDMVELFCLDAIAPDPGWWCFLMDLPEIQPPKKKTVWRMWVVPEPGYRRLLTAYWMPDGHEPSRVGAIRTDKTEDREE